MRSHTRTSRQARSIRTTLIAFLAVLVAAGLIGPAALSAKTTRRHRKAHAPAPVTIQVLSGRADLISGGEALVQVNRPRGSAKEALRVTLSGRNVTSAFNRSGVGLVTGLKVGRNTLTALLADGRGARIVITNYPIGGPIFAGPQVQPWVCNTQNPPSNSGGTPTVAPVGLGPPTDAQCDTKPAVSYMYKDASSGQLTTYDPANPPPSSQIATTTTDQGHTVPYVVRQEFGVEDRGIYAIAMLAARGGWNHKLVTYFGASTAVDHLQSQPSAVLDDFALGRGFMTANSSMNVNGENTNQVVSAEALMMLKEHIIDTYGQIRYTIGEGCSGGSYQYMVAALYPGLLNGIQPNCSFTDIWTTAPDVFDCGLLINYFQNNPNEPWVPAIDGHRDPSDCAAWDALFYSAGDPTNAGNCKLPTGTVYDPALRPTAVRCDIQDYEQAIWGQRPRSEWTAVEKKIGYGFANRPWGNEGVEYGLEALKEGLITPAEFADLNAKIGGLSIDHTNQPERSVVDANTAAIAYRTGQVTDARQLATVPIIDLRAYSETSEIHTSFYSYKMRARLDQANGGHGNQLIWTFPATEPVLGVTPPQDIVEKSFLLMDSWLSKIEADRSGRTLAQKVLADKPSDAVDACFVNPGAPDPGVLPSSGQPTEITDMSKCAQLYPHYGDTRTASGAPLTDEVIQCQLKPLNRRDYSATFTDSEWAQLESAFPHGVCDYSKPGVGFQHAVPWLTFARGPGGEPLGPPPGVGAVHAQAQIPDMNFAQALRRSRRLDPSGTVLLYGERRVDYLALEMAARADCGDPHATTWNRAGRPSRGGASGHARARVCRVRGPWAGAVVFVLDPDSDPERLTDVLGTAQAKLLIGWHSIAEAVERISGALGIDWLLVEPREFSRLLAGTPPRAPLADVPGDAPAILIGPAPFLELGHAALAIRAKEAADEMGFEPGVVVDAPASLSDPVNQIRTLHAAVTAGAGLAVAATPLMTVEESTWR